MNQLKHLTDEMIQQCKLNILSYIELAQERTGYVLQNPDSAIQDILNEFKYLKEIDIKNAFRNGGLGRYGVTYKLTIQVLCHWIREYEKEKNSNNLHI